LKIQRKGSYRLGIAGIAVFVVFMILLTAFCGWLWNCREAGRPTSSFGYEWMAVNTGDMEPEFSKGSLLLLKPLSNAELVPGQVIVSGREHGNGGNLLRFLEADGTRLKVKTDRATNAETIEQETVTHQVAYSIPYLGAAWEFLLTPIGLIAAIAIPCLVFFILELIGLLRFSRWKNPLIDEQADPPKPIFPMLEEDEKENFVDVTDQYAGNGKKYPASIAEDSDEDTSYDDKFADLDFNPLIKQEAESVSLEQIEIPTTSSRFLKVMLDDREVLSVPLEKIGAYRIKNDDWRIDISIAQDDGTAVSFSSEKNAT
jgi:signal peptidase I